MPPPATARHSPGVLAVWAALAIALGLLAWPAARPFAHDAGHAQSEQRLPTIGAAPDFALISQDGAAVSLGDFRGKVVAVTFIYVSCPDVCPMLSDKLARVQDELGPDFGTKVAFVSITVDPERDTPEVLKEYAEALDADLAGWSFLTGTKAALRDVARRYGVAVAPAADGQVDHTLLTTLVDRRGIMRVQYLGYRFDPEEFRHDILDLVHEP
jgi:protein SCO1/2